MKHVSTAVDKDIDAITISIIYFLNTHQDG